MADVSYRLGAERLTPPSAPPFKDMAWIPGGTFTMGSSRFYPEEGPVQQATVSGFWMDETTVTNSQFRRFVKATGYLCAPNYCLCYRPAARHPETVDTSTSHIGFRCIVRSGEPSG
jgi:formylglycine-generating enzyme required for sulfatase activity